MARLERIIVDPLCNNDCVYCLSRRKEQKKKRDVRYKPQIRRALKERKDGIAIVGGEPTLMEGIVDIVSGAKKAGFRRITMPTNARLLSDKDFAADLIEAGVSDFVVKLWGPTKEIHDKITRTEGSFEQAVEGIKNIISLKSSEIVAGRSGILMDNYEYLPDLAKLFADLGITWMSFELPPVENRPIPLVPKTMEYIFEAIKTADRLNVYLGIENIPFCLMKGYEDHVQTYVMRRDRLEDCEYLQFVKPVHDEKKVKTPQCELCTYSFICDGMFREYVEGDALCTINPVEKVRKESVFERIDDLKGKEELFSPLVEDREIPRGLRADAILHFSGGIDSTVAAAFYARRNKGKKIVLVTYRHPGLLLAIKTSRVCASYLMGKYPNIVAHLYVPLLEELHVPLCFGRDYKEHAMRLQSNYGCIACKLMMYMYSTYLHKAFFQGDTIISGNNLTTVPGAGDGGVPTTQIPEITSLVEDFVSPYHMKCINPIYAVSDKQRIILMAKEMGLPPSRVFQPKCILGYPILCEDNSPVVQFVDEKIVPILRNILEINLERLKEEQND